MDLSWSTGVLHTYLNGINNTYSGSWPTLTSPSRLSHFADPNEIISTIGFFQSNHGRRHCQKIHGECQRFVY